MHDPVTLVVESAGEAAATALLDASALPHRTVRTPGRVAFSIANPAASVARSFRGRAPSRPG